MKNLLTILFIAISIASCKSNKHHGSIPGDNFIGSAEVPTYIKDRNAKQYNSRWTNAHGVTGVGSGMSYASTAFRGESLKNEGQENPNNNEIDVDKYFNNEINNESDSLATDSVETDISW